MLTNTDLNSLTTQLNHQLSLLLQKSSSIINTTAFEIYYRCTKSDKIKVCLEVLRVLLHNPVFQEVRTYFFCNFQRRADQKGLHRADIRSRRRLFHKNTEARPGKIRLSQAM